MAQLLQAPTEGYEEAIVIPKIAANNFELKHGLINLVQNKQFFEHDKEDPHAHIRYFNKITSTMRVPNVPSSSIKLMLFPFSLEGAARIWLEKEPPRSILNWGDLVSKFINQFFPPLKTTNLRNEMTRFQQRFDESFSEAWDRFNDLLRACPHHGFSELHQLDTFYNALNVNDQDSLKSAADKKNQSSAPAPSLTPAPIKAVKPNCVTCGDKVGVFHFLADFVVVDFESDPRVPLILERCFLKTDRALIDVHKGELTLHIRNEAITYNLDQTSRYSANYNQMTTNKINVIDMACEEYSQEVLGFSDVTASGNPTPYDDPIVSTTSLTLTPFRDSDFLLFEEADAFLDLEDDLNSLEFNPFYYDPEGDILLLEAILNSKPLPPLPNHEQYMPLFKKELKVCEAKMVKSSVDEPPEVELKDLPPHLEYVFLEGDNKLPVIISKELGDEEKSALIKDFVSDVVPVFQWDSFEYTPPPEEGIQRRNSSAADVQSLAISGNATRRLPIENQDTNDGTIVLVSRNFDHVRNMCMNILQELHDPRRYLASYCFPLAVNDAEARITSCRCSNCRHQLKREKAFVNWEP
nr:reverse transcriptase domain-containing protein [Tanacetum cinerariifolium]